MEELVEVRESRTIMINLPREVVEQAAEDANKWFDSHVEKAFAKIAEVAEFAKVGWLEKRRVEAEATCQAMTARIAKIKAACSEKIVDTPAAIDKAVEEIEQCERAIRTAKLSLDTVDTLLPEATRARYIVSKELTQRTIGQLSNKLREERRAATEAVFQAVQAPGRTLLDLDRRLNRLSTMTRLSEVHVLGYAARHRGDSQDS